MRIRLFVTTLALLVGGWTAAPAQEGSALPAEELDNLTARVAAQLRCPVCRNQSVLESSSGLAREMQAAILERLASGESSDEVIAYFVQSYGEWILLKPEASGVSLLVYVLPALALLGGGLLLWRLFGKWTRPALVGAEPAGAAGSARAPDTGSGDTGLSEEEEAWLQRSIQGE